MGRTGEEGITECECANKMSIGGGNELNELT